MQPKKFMFLLMENKPLVKKKQYLSAHIFSAEKRNIFFNASKGCCDPLGPAGWDSVPGTCGVAGLLSLKNFLDTAAQTPKFFKCNDCRRANLKKLTKVGTYWGRPLSFK